MRLGARGAPPSIRFPVRQLFIENHQKFNAFIREMQQISWKCAEAARQCVEPPGSVGGVLLTLVNRFL